MINEQKADLIQKTKKLLASDFVTEPTKKALTERLNEASENNFFTKNYFNLLNAICDLLMDQNSLARFVNIGLAIDKRLYEKKTDGWRYDQLPPDDLKYKLGLENIELCSQNLYKNSFSDLNKKQQIKILTDIQLGNVDLEIWKNLHPKLFFEDLLAECTEIYYGHPLVQASLNYVGYADAKGWIEIKLNQQEPPEIENN